MFLRHPKVECCVQSVFWMSLSPRSDIASCMEAMCGQAGRCAPHHSWHGWRNFKECRQRVHSHRSVCDSHFCERRGEEGRASQGALQRRGEKLYSDYLSEGAAVLQESNKELMRGARELVLHHLGEFWSHWRSRFWPRAPFNLGTGPGKRASKNGGEGPNRDAIGGIGIGAGRPGPEPGVGVREGRMAWVCFRRGWRARGWGWGWGWGGSGRDVVWM